VQVFPSTAAVTAFGPGFAPAGAVRAGESFVLETADCYDGQFTSADVLRPDIDMARFNRATGPVHVDGIAAGDWVLVRIERIDVRGPGVMAVAPGLGVLGARVTAPSTRLLPVADGRVWLTERVGVPLRPMVGILGVATAGETVPSSVPGPHGGNLDTRLLTPGAALALRANRPGLGLAAGDLHAAMGDGELGGTGVEIGGRVQLSVRDVHRDVTAAVQVGCPDGAHRATVGVEPPAQREGPRGRAVPAQVPQPRQGVLHDGGAAGGQPPQGRGRLGRGDEPPGLPLEVAGVRPPVGERVQRLVVAPHRQVEEDRPALRGLHADAVARVGAQLPHEAGARAGQPVDRRDGGGELAHRRVLQRRSQPGDVDLRQVVHPGQGIR
jgi:amidase